MDVTAAVNNHSLISCSIFYPLKLLKKEKLHVSDNLTKHKVICSEDFMAECKIVILLLVIHILVLNNDMLL